MILQMIGVSETEKEARELIAFSKCFGVMRQVVNDNVDWAPSYLGLSTKTKDAEDAFSDLKNGNITLPLIFHLQNSNKSIIHDYLEGEVSINKESCAKIICTCKKVKKNKIISNIFIPKLLLM